MKFQATKENVKIVGRTSWVDDVLYLAYSASYVEFEFVGSKALVRICSDSANWDKSLHGWVAVFINGEDTPSKLIELTKEKETFELFEAEERKITRIKIMKRSEAAFGTVGIAEIETDSEEIHPTSHQTRKIEIIGDSITCGYGIEGVFEKDTFNTAQENPLKAYSLKTAKAFDAECQLVSWSGIGVISNWVDETVNEPLDNLLMPVLYQYTDAGLDDRLYKARKLWDFERFQPDLIIVHLGTNDDSFVRQIPERESWFAREYIQFLREIHTKNPGVPIICGLGVMGQNLCTVEQEQVERFAKEDPEVNIHYLIFDLQKEEDGIGADWHPSMITHEKIAKSLTDKIHEVMGWEPAVSLS